MTASPLSRPHPRTEALLSIDALPIWGEQSGRRPRPTSPREVQPIRFAPAVAPPPTIAPDPHPHPSQVAAAPGRRERSGAWPIALGVAVGICGVCPFLELQSPETGPAVAARRYAPAAIEPISLIGAAIAATVAPARDVPLLAARAATDSVIAPFAAPAAAERDLAPRDPAPIPEAPFADPADAAMIGPAAVKAQPMEFAATTEPLPAVPPGRVVAAPSGSEPLARRARIVIHYSGGDRPAADAAARRLMRQGVDGIEFRQVPFAVRQQEIRVFHAQDAARGTRVASAASPGGQRLRVSDFRGFRPSPSPGLVEIWVR